MEDPSRSACASRPPKASPTDQEVASAGRGCLSRLCILPAALGDGTQMIVDVVGEVFNDPFERLGTIFGVHAGLFPRLGWGAYQQNRRGCPDRVEEGQRPFERLR